ncbi:bacterial alpha-L-rhamnosidase-domain-containing protein [Annulohypoxylon maeteangense]|uniref:bacterial alpha-L-rhamnosidase-domain-containing protein n=1 Tax=Annulohypoxylon maeteangense TaxID=1927788 RepID=UPI00200825DB|nr:bacterial alpha-L-rhamnosidase-domain-containing protein [Annulohypoxylon maeteangense]KAI0882215.1 bacterial alpha-L-rhamnosidase-domain-containing protein [Annulohypoxylon maeteangense]
MSAPTLTAPTFEHHHSGFGLGYSQPRISWQFVVAPDTPAGWDQKRYEIEITWSADQKVEHVTAFSRESVLVPWPARPLKSRESAVVRVRSHGKCANGSVSPTTWSPASKVEAGFLDRDDWKASFITSSTRIGPNGPLQPLRFRKEFTLDASLGEKFHARLYLTAMGVCQPYINGKPTSDEEMAPGWTSYKHRLNYRVHDVTSLLNPKEKNVISIEVAEGWYAGTLGFRGGTRFLYGDRLAALAQLEVYGDDKSTPSLVVSDESWRCARSPIQSSEIYDGEVYDAQLEDRTWSISTTSSTAKDWTPVTIVPWPSANLVAPDAPPVRITQTIEAVDLFKTKSGNTVIDFGQNLVGRIQVHKIDVPKGTRLTFKHAEVMEHGELGIRPLRLAKATDTVISAGDVIENWAPKFTFHGFRYLQIDGWPEDSPLLSKDNFAAQVMHTDLKRRGDFSCSNALVNQLYQNVIWSMRGNFLSIPTDCPQRNERLGWTGDIQVFCPTASFLFDTVGMLKDWLQDLAAEQLQEGRGGIPPFICPEIPMSGWPHMPEAIWDDIVVLTPHVLYQFSKDEQILSRQFSSMQQWLENGVKRGHDGLWDEDHWQLGDWLDPKAPPNDPSNGPTDTILVADAYLVHTTEVFTEICKVLGKADLTEKYGLQTEYLRRKFQHKYITPAGKLVSNTQTAISLAIEFSLYSGYQELSLAAHDLTKLVQKARFNIATGFAGTPIIAHALTRVHRSQLAYRMLLEKTNPSWLYPVTMGATTIWERWDAMLPDGSINPGTMTSFNHYALGSIADWLHATVGGISPDEPGWKRILVRPIPGGNITDANVSFNGPYGLISCRWKVVNGKFSMTLTIPPNSSARVFLPLDDRNDVCIDETEGQILGSGTHNLECNFEAAEWPPKRLIAPHIQPPEEDIA